MLVPMRSTRSSLLPTALLLLMAALLAGPSCDEMALEVDSVQQVPPGHSLSNPPAPPVPVGEGQPAEVLSVTDGDTLRVRLRGRTERVRLIGIDTPETAGSPRGPQPYNEEATAALRSLVEGETVLLRFDVETADRYDRVLAYVYLNDEAETFVNGEMVRLGWARTLTIPPNVRHASYFAALASVARQEGVGIWQ